MSKRRAVPLRKPRDAHKADTTDESEPAPVLKGRGPLPPVDRSAVDSKLLDLEGVLDALAIVVKHETIDKPGIHPVSALIDVAVQQIKSVRDALYPSCTSVDVDNGVSVQFEPGCKPRVVRDI